jgi:hypothetical protein
MRTGKKPKHYLIGNIDDNANERLLVSVSLTNRLTNPTAVTRSIISVVAVASVDKNIVSLGIIDDDDDPAASTELLDDDNVGVLTCSSLTRRRFIVAVVSSLLSSSSVFGIYYGLEFHESRHQSGSKQKRCQTPK